MKRSFALLAIFAMLLCSIGVVAASSPATAGNVHWTNGNVQHNTLYVLVVRDDGLSTIHVTGGKAPYTVPTGQFGTQFRSAEIGFNDTKQVGLEVCHQASVALDKYPNYQVFIYTESYSGQCPYAPSPSGDPIPTVARSSQQAPTQLQPLVVCPTLQVHLVVVDQNGKAQVLQSTQPLRSTLIADGQKACNLGRANSKIFFQFSTPRGWMVDVWDFYRKLLVGVQGTFISDGATLRPVGSPDGPLGGTTTTLAATPTAGPIATTRTISCPTIVAFQDDGNGNPLPGNPTPSVNWIGTATPDNLACQYGKGGSKVFVTFSVPSGWKADSWDYTKGSLSGAPAGTVITSDGALLRPAA